MGKGSLTKKKLSESQSKGMASYFSPPGSGPISAGADAEPQKMADPGEGRQAGPSETVTREDLRAELTVCLARMEATLLEKLTALIAPQNAQIQTLQETVTQLTQTSESAMELALANKDSSRQMQRHSEWATEKIMFLENQLKMENLKFRGFPEGAEENQEVKLFLSQWLLGALSAGEGDEPRITRAYRLGSSRRAPNSLPRDILARCLDMRTKQLIMTEARKKGFLPYFDYKILVLQDLSAETLEARRRLRPLTSTLTKAKIRYRWQAFTKVQIVYKGTSLTAEDFGSAAKMLTHLGLEVPDELKDLDDQADDDGWQTAGNTG